MKKITIFGLIVFALTFSTNFSFGQDTTLSENFDVACAFTTGMPFKWFVYNPPSTNYSAPNGRWKCDPLNGRKNDAGTLTPGMTCTGLWSSSFHHDTSVLITPLMDLTHYTHAYLHFDTKADTIISGSGLSILVSRDTVFPVNLANYHDTTAIMSPPFSVLDTSSWISHEIDLTSLTLPGSRPVYFAFMYTSTATSGSFWHIDNVNITHSRLSVVNVDKRNIPLTIIGQSSGYEIKIAFGSKVSGNIQFGIYDMVGRLVYKESINSLEANNTHTVSGLNLNSGMYIIKAMDENGLGTTKVLIQ
jgi:Secretion system C-terminal sorting domain